MQLEEFEQHIALIQRKRQRRRRKKWSASCLLKRRDELEIFFEGKIKRGVIGMMTEIEESVAFKKATRSTYNSSNESNVTQILVHRHCEHSRPWLSASLSPTICFLLSNLRV